jgi:hypothetical protein
VWYEYGLAPCVALYLLALQRGFKPEHHHMIAFCVYSRHVVGLFADHAIKSEFKPLGPYTACAAPDAS